MNKKFKNDAENSPVFIIPPLPYSQWTTIFLAVYIFLTAGQCYGDERKLSEYIALSIEELGDIQVTSVSKKTERLADAAASIYVITGEAIRRAGVTTLPEALRLAPNLLVAQINANQYAISARGFNSNTANKLLVMIDGRTVYTPLYSGVFWDAQDVLLQDVERIEVISGSGGTLWGANAVNGVINVITKSSVATVGDLIYAGSGNIGRGVAVRHGGALSSNGGAYRVYAKFDQWRHSIRSSGAAEPDEWNRSQAGFRSDWNNKYSDFTLQGDVYRNSIDQAAPGQRHNNGANVLARWNRQLLDGSTVRIQTYLDHTKRDTPGTFSDRLDLFDLDLQHTLPEKEGKQLIWGGGYRVADDNVTNTDALAFLPAHRRLYWANLFAQQERNLWPDWQFTLGGKLESNIYTGVEVLANMKLTWNPVDDKLLWAKISRAVRAPSRTDTELYIGGKPPYSLAGGPDFRSEIANTLELGWRTQIREAVSYSVVAFHGEYNHLRSLDRLPSGTFVLGNQIEGDEDGLETQVSYQVTESWTLDASALLLHKHFSGPNPASLGNDPRKQWSFGSKWNISANQRLDVLVRHVGKLPSPEIPAYTAVDAHFGWVLSKDIELAISGRNLFDPRHSEFASGGRSQVGNPVQIEREISISLTARF